MPKKIEPILTDEEKQTAAASKAVGDLHDADVFLFRDDIMGSAHRKLEKLVRANRRRPNLTLVLTTIGGLPDTAYRICRLIQQAIGEDGVFRLMIPSICKSAGTLIAIGADRIIMGESGELGPLDVQVQSHEEVGEYNSGLTHIQSLALLEQESLRLFATHFDKLHSPEVGFSTKLAADIAARHTRGLFQVLYKQLDPMRLGEIERAMAIADAYASRVNRGNITASGVAELVGGYPSHGFVIDLREAKRLFSDVSPPDEIEQQFFDCLFDCRQIIHSHPFGLVDCLYSESSMITVKEEAKEASDAIRDERDAQVPPRDGEEKRRDSRSDASSSATFPPRDISDKPSATSATVADGKAAQGYVNPIR